MFNKYLNEYFYTIVQRLFTISKYLQRHSTKKKTDLVGMIIYGHITKNLKKNDTQDILVKVAKIFLKDNDIVIKSLPGYGNADLKKKEMNITNNSAERSIKVDD